MHVSHTGGLWGLTFGTRLGPIFWAHENIGCYVPKYREMLKIDFRKVARERLYHDILLEYFEGWSISYVQWGVINQTMYQCAMCFIRVV